MDPRHPAVSVALHAALLAIDDRHAHPLHLPTAPPPRVVVSDLVLSPGVPVVTLASPRQRRDLARAWGERAAAVVSHAAAEAASVYEQVDQLEGLIPIHDGEGAPLTGDAAVAARRRLLDVDLRALLGDRDGAGFAAAVRARIAAVEPGATSADLDTAREQLLDRLSAAAGRRRAWLLDGADDALGAEQRTALDLLARRRQAGMRAVRRAATVTAARTAHDAAAARVAGVAVEGAPQWRTSSGGTLTLTDGRLVGRALVALTVHARNPAGADGGAALGAVALDPVADSLWTVTGQPVDHTHDLSVTIRLAAAAPAGDHDLVVTARNDRGPAALQVRITVAAAPE